LTQRTLSGAALQSAHAENTGEVWLVLLTIKHPNILDNGGELYFVNDMQNLVAGAKTYIGFPFQIDLPGEDQDQPTIGRLRIDNVDRLIVSTLRELASPPTVDIEVVLASSPTVVEVGFYDMTLRNVTFDALYVEGTLTIESIYVEPITLEMTPSRFPGLFNILGPMLFGLSILGELQWPI
jgi:hypothetical protein